MQIKSINMLAVAGSEKLWVSMKEFVKASGVSFSSKTRTSGFAPPTTAYNKTSRNRI